MVNRDDSNATQKGKETNSELGRFRRKAGK